MHALHSSSGSSCCCHGRRSSSRNTAAPSSYHAAHAQHMQAHVQPLPLSNMFPSPAHHISSSYSSSNRSSSRPHKLTVMHAQRGPDRGSVAALEAALAAINKILGTYSRVRQPSSSKGTTQGSSSNGSGTAGAKPGIAGLPASGPSKLISFGAKASSSVPVKVCEDVSLKQCMQTK
jgi:hypothetical protein